MNVHHAVKSSKKSKGDSGQGRGLPLLKRTITSSDTRDAFYRDLKCENIMLDSNFVAKLTDFGSVAKLSDPTRTNARELLTGILFTVTHEAPEIMTGKSYGRTADVWSLGCVVIELLIGHRNPYQGYRFDCNQLIFQVGGGLVRCPPIPVTTKEDCRDLLQQCFRRYDDVGIHQLRPTSKELLDHCFIKPHLKPQAACLCGCTNY